jgi:YesN/AraC family two-component response regulator
MLPTKPERMKFFLLAVCLEGDLVVQCDSQRCAITEGTIFVCKPGSILKMESGHIQRLSLFMAGDSAGKSSVNINMKKLLPHYEELHSLTHFRLSLSDVSLITQQLQHTAAAITRNPCGLYYHELVRSHIIALIYEFMSMITDYISRQPQKRPHFSHAQVYANQFVALVARHFRTERQMTFYAQQLNISPKYLGSLVKEQTGRSALQWIAGHVVSEAKSLLLSTDISVQQISLELNFPNQSFFGKYFKTHTGMSPGDFRNKAMR